MKVFSLSMTATYHKVFEITAKSEDEAKEKLHEAFMDGEDIEGQPTDFSDYFDVDPLYEIEVIG